MAHAIPAGKVGAKHQAKAHQPEHDAADAAVHEVFHHHVDGILGPRHAALQQGETRLHKEHQGTGEDYPGGINRLISGRLGQWRNAQQDQQQQKMLVHTAPHH